VLTANAGSENREAYNRAGFEGYMVKPVSGEALETNLMRYISADKLIVSNNKMTSAREDINAASGYSGKMPILVTSTSMCDLPVALTKTYIPLLPFLIKTEEGVFKDVEQMSADELIRYLSSGKKVESTPPDEAAYRDFFSLQLKRAHHIIHIAITSSMSEDYQMALEASKSFDNVTVVNSESISSATGILVLIAIKLAQMNTSVEDVVAELDRVKKRLQCSFIVDTTEYMARKGLITPFVDHMARSINIHP
jgi:DegV family protein with EDD domain